MSTTLQRTLVLLRADPHKWGEGKVHQIDTASDRTMCGKTPATCPGTRFNGGWDEVNCQACRNVAERQAQWAQKLRQRAQDNAMWWARYNAYLDTDTWLEKRALVMKRADYVCEGCGEEPAEQVHHTRYPRDCAPGSEQWIASEMLFDLRAVCTQCHENIHRKWNEGGS